MIRFCMLAMYAAVTARKAHLLPVDAQHSSRVRTLSGFDTVVQQENDSSASEKSSCN